MPNDRLCTRARVSVCVRERVSECMGECMSLCVNVCVGVRVCRRAYLPVRGSELIRYSYCD